MFLGLRRMSTFRLFLTFVSCFLVLFLIYDFFTFKSKSAGNLNLATDRLPKIQPVKDLINDPNEYDKEPKEYDKERPIYDKELEEFDKGRTDDRGDAHEDLERLNEETKDRNKDTNYLDRDAIDYFKNKIELGEDTKYFGGKFDNFNLYDKDTGYNDGDIKEQNHVIKDIEEEHKTDTNETNEDKQLSTENSEKGIDDENEHNEETEEPKTEGHIEGTQEHREYTKGYKVNTNETNEGTHLSTETARKGKDDENEHNEETKGPKANTDGPIENTQEHRKDTIEYEAETNETNEDTQIHTEKSEKSIDDAKETKDNMKGPIEGTQEHREDTVEYKEGSREQDEDNTVYDKEEKVFPVDTREHYNDKVGNEEDTGEGDTNTTDEVHAKELDKSNGKPERNEQSTRSASEGNEKKNDFIQYNIEEKRPEDTEHIRSRNKDLDEHPRYNVSNIVAKRAKALQRKFAEYRNAIEYEDHLRDTNATFIAIINKARYLSGLLYNPRIVLVTFVCKTCLPFAYSWLCNTRELELHRNVLLITNDSQTEYELGRKWPEVNLVSLETTTAESEYAKISGNQSSYLLCQLQVINSLLNVGVSVLWFDIRSVWFENPLPKFPKPATTTVDMLVNMVPNSDMNPGFLMLYATDKTQSFWKYLYGMLRRKLREQKNDSVPLTKYYKNSLQNMVESKFETITARRLPVSSYADGMWYLLSDEERAKTQPVVILNNYAIGNDRILRAEKWSHWFLHTDGTCNVDLVRKMVNM